MPRKMTRLGMRLCLCGFKQLNRFASMLCPSAVHCVQPLLRPSPRSVPPQAEQDLANPAANVTAAASFEELLAVLRQPKTAGGHNQFRAYRWDQQAVRIMPTREQ